MLVILSKMMLIAIKIDDGAYIFLRINFWRGILCLYQ